MSIETMTKLATVTVGAGGSASIDFTNIPQTYTDLILKISVQSTRVSGNNMDYFKIKLNGSTSGYSDKSLYGNGSSGQSETNNSTSYGFDFVLNGTSGSQFSNAEMYLPNYTSSNYKFWSFDAVAEENAVAAIQALNANLWSNTAAITSISIESANVATLKQHSTATLYGIKNARKVAGNSVKATGGNISFDGTYVIHTFTTSGTFAPITDLIKTADGNLLVDYLVVAGGGGAGQTAGGGWQGGPGGAGGYRYLTGQKLSGTSVTAIAVGAGGAGGAFTLGGGNQGANGGNSSVGNLSSTGGGGGGTTGTNGKTKTSGKSGGSGGGSAQDTTSNTGGAGNAGGYTPVEGYAGGNVTGNPPYVPGQGGGSSGAGSQTNAAATNGTANSISGSSVTYATGGSSGSFGNADATPNTGNGGNSNTTGSSGNNDAPGWNGGSGVVIIRYKA